MKRYLYLSISIIFFFWGFCLAQGYDFLVREAEGKMTEGNYEKALALFEKALKTGEYHYNDYLNMARIYVHMERSDTAFIYLNKAVKTGFVDQVELEEDPTLATLKGHSKWNVILKEMKKQMEVIQSTFPDKHKEDVVIDLPQPNLKGTVSVEEAVYNRRSIRQYAKEPLNLEEISQLLWAAFGITKPLENAPAFLRGGLRAAPSAGARYPLDLYVVVRNVTGLDVGVYYYKSETHQLVQISKKDKWQALSESAFHQSHFETAAAAIVYSAVFERCMMKYGQRGRERYVCMDLGHSGQNVYLQATAMNIGTCAIGAFTDIYLKKAVGMTKEEEPLYIMPLGKVEKE